MSSILVTGATGHIGGDVLRQLITSGRHPRAMSRKPGPLRSFEGVEWVYGDLLVPESLDAALEAIDTVFLVWLGPLAAAAPAIARIATHDRHVVLLTSPHQTPHPFFQQPNGLRAVHAGVERLIVDSGLRWTFLRPGPFAVNCVYWWGDQIRAGDVVRWTYAGAETAPIHEHDIASVAVRALTEDGHAGMDYFITGPEALTQRRQVEILGDVIGRSLRFEELPRDAGKKLMTTTMPPAVADMLLDAYAASVGLPALVTPTVEQVSGTPALTFAQWVADHADRFH